MRYTIVSETNHPIVVTNIFYLLVVSPGRLVSQKCSDTPCGCQAPPRRLVSQKCSDTPRGCQAPPRRLVSQKCSDTPRGCQAPPSGCQAPPQNLNWTDC